jgi:hypothetical protein
MENDANVGVILGFREDGVKRNSAEDNDCTSHDN